VSKQLRFSIMGGAASSERSSNCSRQSNHYIIAAFNRRCIMR